MSVIDAPRHGGRDYVGLVAIPIIAGLGVLAWTNRFVQDDAFISFRYARHLANGQGLVWNVGERVEGFTNFLWILLMAIPERLHRDPVPLSMALGMIAFVASLGLTYKLTDLLLSSKKAALLTVVLLGTNYSFSCYATGGLETQLQTALFAASVFVSTRALVTKEWSNASGFGLSVLLVFAVLTRPDSVVLAGIILPVAGGFVCFGSTLSRREKRMSLAWLVVPFVTAVSGFGLWKLHYFGSLLPNSYYVKIATAVSFGNGLGYVYAFLRSYWLLPMPLLLAWYLVARRREIKAPMLVPLALVVVWLAYVVLASGDFMEFRFIVPILPYVFLFTAWLVVSLIRGWKAQAAVVAVVLLGSWHHARTFERTDDLDGIRWSASLLAPEGSNWIGIGKVLGDAFPHASDITIAVNPAGAIPYYSELRTIDMLGLNDAWIARHGRILSTRPGHQRIATLDYLIKRRTHLLIGHPLLVPMDFEYRYDENPLKIMERFLIPLKSIDEIPADAQVLEIPIDAGRKLVAVYLQRDSRIDDVIRRNGWRVQPLRSVSAGATLLALPFALGR